MSMLRLANSIIELTQLNDPKLISIANQINNYVFDKPCTATSAELVALLYSELNDPGGEIADRQKILDLLWHFEKYLKVENNGKSIT